MVQTRRGDVPSSPSAPDRMFPQLSRFRPFETVRSGQRLIEPIVAILVPVLVLHLGLYQLHPRVGWVDPGLYIFNFLRLPKNMASWSTDYYQGANYHFARLPYILPGYWIYRVLEPVRAQAVLITVFYGLGVASLFVFARTLINSVARRLTLVWLIALNPLWITAFVFGYVDGPAMAFGFLSFAALMASRPTLLWLPRPFWAGAAVALTLSTQPFAGGLTGLVFLMFGVMAGLTWVQSFRFVCWGALGGIFACAALGFLGTLLGVPFLFLLASGDWLHRVFAGALYEFIMPPERWLPSATRLVLWPIAFSLLLTVVTGRGYSNLARRPFALCTALLVSTVIFLIVDLASLGFLSQYHCYDSYLFFSLVPPLALLIEYQTRDTHSAWDWLLAPCMLAFGLAGAFAAPWLTLSQPEAAVSLTTVWIAVVLLGFAAFAAFRAGRSMLGLLGVAALLTLAGVANRDTGTAFALPNNPNHRSYNMALAEVHKALAEAGASDKRILSWFNRNAFTRATSASVTSLYEMNFRGRTYHYNLLDSITASFGWNQTSFGFDMPHLDELWHRQFADLGRTPSAVVLLCAHEQECREGLRVTAISGVHVVERLQRRIEVADAPSFAIIIADAGRGLLSSFPCMAERERVAYWFDRDTSKSPEKSLHALQRFFAVTGPHGAPASCFHALEEFTRALSFDWTDRVPPPTGNCEADLNLARLYFNSIFDGRLRGLTAGSLEKASSAFAENRRDECVSSAARVRKAYFDAVAAELRGHTRLAP